MLSAPLLANTFHNILLGDIWTSQSVLFLIIMVKLRDFKELVYIFSFIFKVLTTLTPFLNVKKDFKDILVTPGYRQSHRSEISLSYRYHNHGRNYLNDRPSLRSAPGTYILIYSYYDCWQSLF